MSTTAPGPSPPRPEQAFILAAGLGTRLHPLTATMPKAMAPLWDRPLLEYALTRLRHWGVRRVLLNTHHRAPSIIEYLRTRPADGLEIALSHEPARLGTGGALIRGRWFFRPGPFWMLNADILASLPAEPLLDAADRTGAPACMWVDARRGPRTVALDGDRVRTFVSPSPGARGTVTLCGVHLFQDCIWDPIPRREQFCSLVHLLEPLRKARAICAVDIPEARWDDLGTPERLLRAHTLVEQHHRRDPVWRALAGPAIRRSRRRFGAASATCVHPQARIHDRARLTRSVVCAGASVGPRANLRDALVAPGARVDTEAAHLLVPAEHPFSPAEQRTLNRAGLMDSGSLAEILPARGSDRRFIRLHTNGRTCIVVRTGDERRENRLMPRLTRALFDAGIAVPRLLHHAPRLRLQVYEDAGRQSLLDALPGLSPRQIRLRYQRVLDLMNRFHEDGLEAVRTRRIPLMPAFGPALYRWEHDLFIDHCLRPHLPRMRVEPLRRDLGRVAEELADERDVLLHRDLQSANILLRNGRPVVIDFQGARRGPAVYDLAALLYDPYAALSPDQRESLLQTLDAPRVRPSAGGLRCAAIQRLTQALGAYARLARVTGNPCYRALIPPTLQQWRALARDQGSLPRILQCADGLLEALVHD